MCTASWSVGSGLTTLCFNRDEARTRPRAVPPREIEADGRRLLAPIDPPGGGTWICVNARGICFFLLNNYEASASFDVQPTEPKSRGLLPLQAAVCDSVADFESWLSGELLNSYRPFFLGAVGGGTASLFAWDGSELRALDASSGFVTTSSFRSQEVQAYRKRRYGEMLGGMASIDLDERFAYHVDVSHPDPAYNPLMSRPDAETHNVTSIEVSEKQARMRFAVRISGSNELSPEQVSALPLHSAARRSCRES